MTVEAQGFKVRGVLLDYEKSNHGGFGNLVLENNGLRVLIRGSMVETIKVKKEPQGR